METRRIPRALTKKQYSQHIVVISNIDFNEAFKKAIEEKKVAEEQAKAEQEKVKIAEAQANIKIATAEGEKQKIQLEADAQAYSTIELAKAEAESLRLKRQQLTPLMVENNRIDKWDGAYPKYMLSSGANMLFQIPNDESYTSIPTQNTQNTQTGVTQ